MPQGFLGLLLLIYFPLIEPANQISWLDIYQLHLVGLIKDVVRYSFPDHNSGNGSYNIVEAFDMLNINSSININACIKQLLDILISF